MTDQAFFHDPDRNLYALPLGTELMNTYQIGRALGSGGFAITYLARNTRKNNALVAIKELLPEAGIRLVRGNDKKWYVLLKKAIRLTIKKPYKIFWQKRLF